MRQSAAIAVYGIGISTDISHSAGNGAPALSEVSCASREPTYHRLVGTSGTLDLTYYIGNICKPVNGNVRYAGQATGTPWEDEFPILPTMTRAQQKPFSKRVSFKMPDGGAATALINCDLTVVGRDTTTSTQRIVLPTDASTTVRIALKVNLTQ